MGTTTPEVRAVTTSGDLRIEMRRVLRATRQRVYEAWTRPEELRRWFGPGAITTTEAEADLRPGGRYRVTVKGSIDGLPEQRERIMHVEGVYLELIPDQLIRFTWKPAWTPGEESEVTIHLRDAEGGTEMVLIHDRFASSGSCAGHTRGWASSIEKLSQYLSR